MSEILRFPVLRSGFAAVLAAVFLLFCSFRPGHSLGEDVLGVPVPGLGEVKVHVEGPVSSGDLEGRLKDEGKYYFLRCRVEENSYSMNLPARVYGSMTSDRRERFVREVLLMYRRVMLQMASMLDGRKPRYYRFSITFGRSGKGHPFNTIYERSKNSNIFADTLPYGTGDRVFTDTQKYVLLHEIAHSMISIRMGGTRSAWTRAVEEGVADIIAERAGGAGKDIRSRIPITRAQADNMSGLTQLDLDISIWGKKALILTAPPDGYAGVTHHHFGRIFIEEFIRYFGESRLLEFLIRLRSAEDEEWEENIGTKKVRDILRTMGYDGGRVDRFEQDLHRSLKKEIFTVI